MRTPPALRRVCAWCAEVIAIEPGAAGSTGADTHGICLECLGERFDVPIMAVSELGPDVADRLPYGRIVLDSTNRVISYNRVESDLARRRPEAVVGKNFFEDVAPCTNVAALAGWVASARERGAVDRTELDFIFDFPFGRAFVHLALAYDPANERTVVLVQKLSEE